MKQTLAIIGAGNMGAAFCSGLQKNFPELTLMLADRHAERLAQFPGIQTTLDPVAAVRDAESVLIAVKPQAFLALCAELSGLLTDKLVISIMAGKTIATIQEKTGAQHIMRAMPNLGVQVGRGITAWVAAEGVSADDENFARQLFAALGAEMQLAAEALIDRFAAVAGCGPAYFFALCRDLIAAAEKNGFSPAEAQLMVRETFAASAMLFDAGTKTAAEWISAVASKGGMTETALEVLAEQGVPAIFEQALTAAVERAQKLQD